MNKSQILQLIKKMAYDLGLNYNSKNKFKHINCKKRHIIIRNFLGKSPDPIFVKYGNQKRNVVKNLVDYLKSDEYKGYLERANGCIMNKKELKRELKIINKIPDEKLKIELLSFYLRVEKQLDKSNRIVLVWYPNEQVEKRDEVLTHEFIHEFLEENKIKLKAWKWNEGLVIYITFCVLGFPKYFLDSIPKRNNKFFNICSRYAHYWAKILHGKDPVEKNNLIRKKMKEVNNKLKKN